jgi:tetratricopeptide (TPR) repeat protein
MLALMTSSDKESASAPGEHPAAEPVADFFISYANEDKDWATWIAWELEESDFRVVLQEWDFHAGSNFVLEMQRAASQASKTIAVLSPAYLSSEFGRAEWADRFVQDPTGEKGLLIPVRVRHCQLPNLLRPILYVDLLGQGEAEARKKLLDAIQRIRRKPSEKPRYPGKRRVVSSQPEFPQSRGEGGEADRKQGFPAIWNLPRRNRYFSGRETELADLERKLKSGQYRAIVQAIHGLGGLGKTQLAREYAHRHASEYHIVWWIRSGTSANLAEDFSALARELGVLATAVPPAEIGFPAESRGPGLRASIAAIHAKLKDRHDWLLIFDSAPDATAIGDFLPRMVTGHVIITSRNPGWSEVAAPLSLAVFERQESLQFLAERTGLNCPDEADPLAEVLGDLPLALEHAAAYVVDRSITMAQYLALFQVRHAELLARAKPPQDYPATVLSTWTVSMDIVEKESPAASDLLRFLAHLSPDAIPRDVLQLGRAVAADSLATLAGDPVLHHDAIELLRRFSLVSPLPDSLSVHRVVQLVLRDSLSRDERRRWAGSTLAVLAEAFRFDYMDPDTWKQGSKLVPSVLAAARHAETEEAGLVTVQAVLDRAGRCLYVQGRFAAAMEVFQRGLRIAEKALGPGHGDVAELLNDLGLASKAQGDYAAARECLERSLSICEHLHGPDHDTVVTRLGNLGVLRMELGDNAGAEPLVRRALDAAERLHGPDHVSVARCLTYLGGLLDSLGQFSSARDAQERALGINETALGADHPLSALSKGNLAGALTFLDGPGDLARARRLLEQALRTLEKVYGPDHPELVDTLCSLSSVLGSCGDPSEARTTSERALCLGERYYGPEHPSVGEALVAQAAALGNVDDLLGAQEAAERALSIDEQALGMDHPSVARDLRALGLVLFRRGDPDGAAAAAGRALRIDVTTRGPDHFRVAEDLRLAAVVCSKRQPTKARELWERVLAIDEKAYGLDHPDVADDLVNLAEILRDLGNRAAARTRLLRAIAIRRKLLGDAHPRTRAARRVLQELTTSRQPERRRKRR